MMINHTENGEGGDPKAAGQLAQAIRSVIGEMTREDLFETFGHREEEEYLKRLLGAGVPLFEAGAVTVYQDRCEQAFSLLLGTLTDTLPEAAQDLGAIQRAFDEGELSPHDLLTITLEHRWSALGQLARTMAVDIDLLQFFTLYLARPFRQQAGERLAKPVDFRLWQQGYCPVCGHGAVLGRQGGSEGQRRLWCCGCNTEWGFSRIQCVFCRNRAPKELGYLTIDAFPGRRIYVCDKCKRYLKVIESSNDKFEAAFVYDLAYFSAVALDRIALSEGYVSQPLWMRAYEPSGPRAALTEQEPA